MCGHGKPACGEVRESLVRADGRGLATRMNARLVAGLMQGAEIDCREEDRCKEMRARLGRKAGPLFSVCTQMMVSQFSNCCLHRRQTRVSRSLLVSARWLASDMSAAVPKLDVFLEHLGSTVKRCMPRLRVYDSLPTPVLKSQLAR